MNEQIKCKRCKGVKSVWVTLRDLAGRNKDGFGNEHVIACPSCNGKGYLTQEDLDNNHKTF